jgi:hypothetical protein
MNLYQYFIAIKDKKPINLTRFLSLLPAQHQNSWRSIFDRKHISGNQYLLTVIDDVIFEQLLELTKPIDSMPEGARQGDSHKGKCSVSYLLVYPSVNLATSDNTVDNYNADPQLVLCDDSSLKINFQCQKTLIIIENQENFFRYQEFLPHLFTMTINSETCIDVAFGQGNNVTNSLNDKFFDQYQQVLCCFDYDLGGLTMYLSLCKLTNAKVRFIQPKKEQLTGDDFLKRHFRKVPDKVETWHKAITLAKQLNFPDLAQAFSTSQKFMEQEVFLSDKTFCLPQEKR